jgi:hypothetical protein
MHRLIKTMLPVYSSILLIVLCCPRPGDCWIGPNGTFLVLGTALFRSDQERVFQQPDRGIFFSPSRLKLIPGLISNYSGLQAVAAPLRVLISPDFVTGPLRSGHLIEVMIWGIGGMSHIKGWRPRLKVVVMSSGVDE